MKSKQHPFESGLERLEKISSELNNDETPLETALELYEEGVKLAAKLTKYLSQAERRILLAPEKLEAENSLEDCEPLEGSKPGPKKQGRGKKASAPESGSLF